MGKFIEYLIDLLSQFAGGRGDVKNERVRFGLGMFFWGLLLVVARIRSRRFSAPREKLLAWGFAIGFVREGLMFIVFTLKILNLISPARLHAFFPPAEHGFQWIQEKI